MIYLDNSATTYPKPKEVYEALDYANRNLAFNAGRGNYKYATNSANIIKEAREEISSFVCTSHLNVTFLSSATEALNIIIYGLNIKKNSNIYISPFEHNAIVRPLYMIKKDLDFNIFIIPFKKDYSLDVNKLQNMFAVNPPSAVFLSHVSNVTGFILPYEEIFKLSRSYQSVNILDAAQSFGIVKINKTNLDFIVFAGHKSLYASFGIAGFINLNDYKLKIIKSGGNGQDSLNHDMPEKYYARYESGSSNVVAIYSLLISSKWLKTRDIFNKEKELTKYLVEQLQSIDKVKLYIPPINKLIGIVSFNIEGYNADEVAKILAEEFDICVRSGYHCSPFVHDFINSKEHLGTVRVSLGAFNTKNDIDALILALNTL